MKASIKRRKFLVWLIVIFSCLLILLTTIKLFRGDNHITQTSIVEKLTPTPPPFPYKIPTIPNKRAYITFLVGDSMIGAWGVNANQLRLELISLYPTHEFVNYNYGFGSTNILSVPNRLNSQTTYLNQNFPPVIGEQFDLIIFDSFAYNPLSQFPLEEGLKKQNEILDESIKEMITKHPNSVVAIMAPIAPNQTNFAKGTVNLSLTQRKQWVDERVAYIKNAIAFAQKNNIPLINVYEKSLTANGDGNLKYINPSDYIHPSVEGIKLMSQVTADFIHQNNIFPE